MAKEKITNEFTLKEIDETKNSFIKEIKQNELQRNIKMFVRS